MKITAYFKAITCSFLLVFALSASANESATTSVAVLDFETQNRSLEGVGSDIANLLAAELSTDINLVLVERAELAKILSEQELGASGAVNAQTAAKIGHLVGAQVLVSGRAFSAGKKTILVGKAYSTETSRVFAAKATYQNESEIDVGTATLATQLGKLIADNRNALVVPEVTDDTLVAEMKAVTQGHDSLPTLSFDIPEEHIGQAIPDPAAETELIKLFKEAGFTVLDAKNGKSADIHITGEAFSQRGLPLRNLVSCSARLEIKALPQDGNAILFTDSAQTVVVDLAENVAAKTALSKAARLLALDLTTAVLAD